MGHNTRWQEISHSILGITTEKKKGGKLKNHMLKQLTDSRTVGVDSYALFLIQQ